MKIRTYNVEVRNNYGTEAIYPTCEIGKAFCRIAGTTTLTPRTMFEMRDLGYKPIQDKPNSPKVKITRIGKHFITQLTAYTQRPQSIGGVFCFLYCVCLYARCLYAINRMPIRNVPIRNEHDAYTQATTSLPIRNRSPVCLYAPITPTNTVG